MYYAGIGSRSTPADVLALMAEVGRFMALDGHILRSGGAEGADTAFHSGAMDAWDVVDQHGKLIGFSDSHDASCDGPTLAADGTPCPVCMAHLYSPVEVYKPWPSFGGDHLHIGTGRKAPAPWTFAIAEEHHPAWDRCSQAAKKLHARNVHQVLGHSQADAMSSLVICWTPGARGGGGTGQALRIARSFGIPVHDLADDRLRARYQARVLERKAEVCA